MILFFSNADWDAAGRKRIRNLAASLLEQGIESKVMERTENHPMASLSGIGELLSTAMKGIAALWQHRSHPRRVAYFYEIANLHPVWLLLARMLGYTCIYDMTEDARQIPSGSSLRYTYRLLWFRVLWPFLPLLLDGVAVISGHLENAVQEAFGSRLPWILIPVSYRESDIPKGELSSEMPPVMFYGGNLGAEYDIELLLGLLPGLREEFPGLVLEMTGKAGPETLAKLPGGEQALREGAVRLLGFLDEPSYFRHLGSATVLCLPRSSLSRASTGFPFKLAEYLASGKPVVTSEVGDIGKYLGKDEAFLYPAGDAEGLRDALTGALRDPQGALDVGRRGRDVARECFEADKVAGSFLAFVRQARS